MIDTATENLICLKNNIEVQHQVIFKSTTLKVNYGDNLCTGVVLGDSHFLQHKIGFGRGPADAQL